MKKSNKARSSSRDSVPNPAKVKTLGLCPNTLAPKFKTLRLCLRLRHPLKRVDLNFNFKDFYFQGNFRQEIKSKL